MNTVTLVGRPLTATRASYVDVDNQGGAALATRHLIGLGHQRIALITNAAPASTPRIASMPYPERLSVKRLAQVRAPTAIIAMMATVMAVPTPITRVATTPAQNSPCARAKTSTRIAPEQGRRPTATIADKPRFQPPGPANSSGSSA